MSAYMKFWLAKVLAELLLAVIVIATPIAVLCLMVAYCYISDFFKRFFRA